MPLLIKFRSESAAEGSLNSVAWLENIAYATIQQAGLAESVSLDDSPRGNVVFIHECSQNSNTEFEKRDATHQRNGATGDLPATMRWVRPIGKICRPVAERPDLDASD